MNIHKKEKTFFRLAAYYFWTQTRYIKSCVQKKKKKLCPLVRSFWSWGEHTMCYPGHCRVWPISLYIKTGCISVCEVKFLSILTQIFAGSTKVLCLNVCVLSKCTYWSPTSMWWYLEEGPWGPYKVLDEVISVGPTQWDYAYIRSEGQEDPSLPTHVHWRKAVNEWMVVYKGGRGLSPGSRSARTVVWHSVAPRLWEMNAFRLSHPF